MNPIQRPDSFEAADYVGWLRRRWWIVLVLTLAGLIAAFGYVTVAAKSYTATAAVNVTPVATDQANVVSGPKGGSTSAVNLNTEAQIVVSANVATLAQHMLHTTATPYQLSKQVAITVPPNSSVLDINCTASTPAGAAACAQDFAKAYLQNRTDTAVGVIKGDVRTLQGQISALQKAVRTLTSKISTMPKHSSVLRYDDIAQRKSDQNQIHLLSNQAGNLTGQLANTSGGTIITPASPPGKPSSPSKSLVLPSGLVGGLVIGLIVGFLADRRDKRVHRGEDVERHFDVPVLLNLPPGTFGREVSIVSPRSKAGHAFTELGNTVSAALGDGNHVLLVAGTGEGASRSAIAANLAATLARTHGDAVLVCADLNDTLSAEILGLNGDTEGLAEVVTGNATIRDVARKAPASQGLWVITPGVDSSVAVYGLRYDIAQSLTSRLRRDARFVIIEAQATEEGADTFSLAEFADAAVLTVEISRTKRADAADCIRRLRLLHAPILGAVVSEAVSRRPVVRPPRDRHPRVGPAGALESSHLPPDHDELSAIANGVPDGVPDRRDRPVRSRDGHGSSRPDRVPGN